MSALVHPSEDDLITYHLQEHNDPLAVRHHIERCAACAVQSDAIAESLRVFSADSTPEPDVSRSWKQIRGKLPVVETTPRRRFSRMLWPATGLIAATLTAAIFLTTKSPTPARSHEVSTSTRQGPLSTTPADPEVAEQLERAERLLTEVNHASGPLDEETRAQAHTLLLKNAVSIRSARQDGDFATASVLETFGRVLTTIDHQPEAARPGWHLRFELNTEGLLLDIRILRQNDSGL